MLLVIQLQKRKKKKEKRELVVLALISSNSTQQFFVSPSRKHEIIEIEQAYSLSVRDVACQRHRVVVELFVIVHPHFSSSSGVPGENVSTASGERVRMTFSKHVADARARNNLQAAAALPHSERYL